MKPRLLMFDDEPKILHVVGQFLVQNEFEFKGSDAPFVSVVETFQPRVILLDGAMPQKDGLEFLGELRRHPQYKNLPVIMVSGRTKDLDQQTGLNRGADDYIVKPFDLATLLARVRALLRRSEDLLVIFDDGYLRVFRAEPLIEIDGTGVRLALMQWTVLSILIRAKRPVSRAELHKLSRVRESCTSRAIDMAISQLRALIHSRTQQRTYIQTVRGLGYYFLPTEK